jgi:secretion/DNA translocation related CpaE-like protein
VNECDVLAVTESDSVQELVLSTAAALDLRAKVASRHDDVAHWWSQASTVCISEGLAQKAANWALPKRDGIVLLGGDDALLAKWSAPLDAKVIPLPDGALWLGSILDESASRVGTPVLAVMGGTGGVGASTLAAGIAVAAADRGRGAALVDVDILGGGIDLLLGVEQQQGWRWPNLTSAVGYVGDLREYLPEAYGVSVVSTDRLEEADLAGEPLTAIVHSLRRSHDLVVIDVGRSLSVASREAVRLATHRLMLVSPTVRGVAGAGQLLQAHQLETASGAADVQLVLRGKGGSGFSATTVAEVLACRVVGRVRDEPSLIAAADQGDSPVGGIRRGYRNTCVRLVRQLLGESDG